MPKIDIRRPHQLSIAEARAVVDQVAARMHEKFGMDGRWQDDTLLFSRPGVSGSIAVAACSVIPACLAASVTPSWRSALLASTRRAGVDLAASAKASTRPWRSTAAR